MTAVFRAYEAVGALRRFILALAVLLGIFATGFSWVAWHDESSRQTESLTALAELGGQSVNAYFLALQGALRIASEDLLDRDDRIDAARTDSVLKRIKSAYPELRSVTLIRTDGQLIATDSTTGGKPLPNLYRLMVQRALEERARAGPGKLTIGRVIFGPVSKEWIIPVGYGVLDRGGKLQYLLGAGLSAEKPQSLWQIAPLPQDAAMGMRRDDGFVINHYPLPRGVTLETVYSRPASGHPSGEVDGRSVPKTGSFEAKDWIGGEQTRFVAIRLRDFPLTFYVADPSTNLRAAWWVRVRVPYLLILALMLGGLLVYRYAMTRQLVWEQERAAQLEKLESANRELEEFAYTVAHDLKAPARAIDGFAAIVVEDSGAALPESARDGLARIRASAMRMARLVEDLLAFSRYSRTIPDLREVNMAALVAEVLAEHIASGSNVEVRTGELPPCRADPELMRVVWNQLISNAVKYSRHAHPPVIEIGHAAGEYFVSDNGAGFDMAHASKLFGVFSRLHSLREFEGTGAGLAIARRILERHGGRISAQAAPGKGAKFSFSVGATHSAPR